MRLKGYSKSSYFLFHAESQSTFISVPFLFLWLRKDCKRCFYLFDECHYPGGSLMHLSTTWANFLVMDLYVLEWTSSGLPAYLVVWVIQSSATRDISLVVVDKDHYPVLQVNMILKEQNGSQIWMKILKLWNLERLNHAKLIQLYLTGFLQ